MNVQEKSDCAVVPVNQPNNEGLLSAEVGEGRAQTEENNVQSYMCPTQSGKTHVPEIARCVASSKIRFAAIHPQSEPYASTRTYGSVRGALSNQRPYRDNWTRSLLRYRPLFR